MFELRKCGEGSEFVARRDRREQTRRRRRAPVCNRQSNGRAAELTASGAMASLLASGAKLTDRAPRNLIHLQLSSLNNGQTGHYVLRKHRTHLNNISALRAGNRNRGKFPGGGESEAEKCDSSYE